MTSISIAVAHTQDLEKKLFWSLIAMLVLMLVMYVFFVNATVMNIVGRQTAERAASSVNSHISDLESQYLALASGITPEYAHSIGFAETKTEAYATRKVFTMADTGSLTRHGLAAN